MVRGPDMKLTQLGKLGTRFEDSTVWYARHGGQEIVKS